MACYTRDGYTQVPEGIVAKCYNEYGEFTGIQDPSADNRSWIERTLDGIGDFFASHWWHILLILILLALLYLSVRIVQEKDAIIVQRFGKFQRVRHAGLRLIVPFIERIVYTMSLQIVETSKDIRVKTEDDVFVTLPVTVQYRVKQDGVKEAYYEIEDPHTAILKLVLNSVRSSTASMKLQEVFASRTGLAERVRQDLEGQFNTYGYEIVTVIVDNPLLSEKLEAVFNNIMAAQRDKEAATAEAEALKIRQIGEASANAAGLEINATAQVNYRNTLAEGHADAVRKMVDGTDLDGRAVLRYFEVTDRNDAIRDASRNGATVVVASPNSADGLYSALRPTEG